MTFNMLFVALVALVPLASAQKMGWKDSYSINGKCYCDTTFDHDIGGFMVDGPNGQITVREACALAGSGPEGDRVYYNDIQCGNGPANNAGDEDSCPGRVDLGDGNRSGCQEKGPKWDLGGSTEPEEPTPPPPAPVVQDLNLQQEVTEYDEIADEPADVDSIDSDTADPPVDDVSDNADEPSEGPDDAFFEQADTKASGSMITGLVVTNSGDGSTSPFSGIIVIDNYPSGFGIRAEVSDSSVVKSVNFKDSSGQERTEFNEMYDMFGSTGSWPNPPAGGVVVLTVTATMTDGTSETIEANVEFV